MTWMQWLSLAGAAVGSLVLGLLVSALVRLVVGRLVRRTATTWDDIALKRLAGPLSAALALAVLSAVILTLSLPPAFAGNAYRLVRASYFAVFFWTLFRLVDIGFHMLGESMWARSGPSRSLIPLGSRVVKVGVLAIAAVAVLSYLGFPVASLIAGLGIGGLALALAAQKTVENLFGAFSIGVDQPFRVGDTVKVEDFTATVERIGLRSTRFRTLDRSVVTIPNGRLADSRIESLTARDRLRMAMLLGLRYSTTERQVRQVLGGVEDALRSHPKIVADSVSVRLVSLGASSLDIEVVAAFQTEQWAEFLEYRQESLLRFLGVVEGAGTSLAFPTRTIHLAGGGGPPGGDSSGRTGEVRAREGDIGARQRE